MQYLVNAFYGRMRMLNWKSGDVFARVTQTEKSPLFKSLVALAKREGVKHGR